MKVKRFFSKRLNILIFVTVLFGAVGFLFSFVVPNTIFNNQIDEIEGELHELAINHETITEVDSTKILYIYKNGESSMLTSTGYIMDIDEEVEHHLIHWSEDQFVETLLYRDDFQNKLFIYYIYVVEDDYYVVSFADTKEVHMFVDTFRVSSLIVIGILYTLTIVLSSTVVSSSLIKQYSLFDPVTNLNTKISLLNKYNNKDLSNYNVQYFVIENLEQIIDACGIQYQDNILKMIATNISKHHLSSNIYQIASNEYLLMQEATESTLVYFDDIINEKEKAMTVTLPYDFKVKTLSIDPTILSSVDIPSLIKQLDYAYSKIKNTKTKSYTINQELIDELIQAEYYQSKLEQAIKERHITNFYQPKVSPLTNQIIGAEALSRWFDDGQLVSPAKYIYLAEANGLIYEIDLISLENSILFIKHLQEQGLLQDYFKISTNFSPITLQTITFDTIKALLDKHDVSPEHISIEITESAIIELEAIEDLLQQLSTYGITIEIDDFSAGNSSFTVLSLIHANVVKLDRAILPVNDNQEREKLIYHSLVDISQKLGLKIISEGVENNTQKSFVKELGVEGIQGYFYSKPLNLVSFVDYIKTY